MSVVNDCDRLEENNLQCIGDTLTRFLTKLSRISLDLTQVQSFYGKSIELWHVSSHHVSSVLIGAFRMQFNLAGSPTDRVVKYRLRLFICLGLPVCRAREPEDLLTRRILSLRGETAPGVPISWCKYLTLLRMETKKIFFVFFGDNRNLGNRATLKIGQKGFSWNVSQTDSTLLSWGNDMTECVWS